MHPLARRFSYPLCWLALLASCASQLSRAAPLDATIVGFMTQDANGFYALTFTHGKVSIVGRFGEDKVDRIEPYAEEKVQGLWDEIEKLAAEGLDAPMDEAHLHPELNYLVSRKSADEVSVWKRFSFPKCARNPRVDDVMQRLTHGLLPAGSPGLYPGKCAAQ